MRQTHVAGERLFVDFAGQTVPITDPLTGTVRQAQIFVAALGASNYTYVEARWSQGLADWIGCHVNALTFFGGVTSQIVCDNLKAGVTAACRYEPGINRTYQDMAAHYGTSILPARVHRPRDKAIPYLLAKASDLNLVAREVPELARRFVVKSKSWKFKSR